MGAHTPGPWRITDGVYPSFLKVDGPSFKLSVVMQATDLDESDYQSRLADLHLIAAAPELLEALEDAMRSARHDFAPGLDGEAQFRNAYAEQFAAIATAKGGL